MIRLPLQRLARVDAIFKKFRIHSDLPSSISATSRKIGLSFHTRRQTLSLSRSFATSSSQQFKFTQLRSIRPYYEQPSGNPRGGSGVISRFLSDPTRLIYSILGLNCAVSVYYFYAESIARRYNDIQPFVWMRNNFFLSIDNIKKGRIWTLITSTICHANFSHLAFNMLMLYSLGPQVATLLGTREFLKLYIGSGLVGSLVTLLYKSSLEPGLRKITGQPPRTHHNLSGACGSSLSLMGMTSFYALVFPRSQFLLFFVIPVPAWALVLGYFAYDTFMAVGARDGQINSAGHVGGLVAGVLYWISRGRLRAR